MVTKKARGRPPHEDILTPAEWRVLEGVRHGMTNRQIASRRGISLDAVKYHVTNILQKLHKSNRGELRTWTGVADDSAFARKDQEKTMVPGIDCIGQVSRNVSDIKAATGWFRDVLGLTHLYSFGDIAFFDCGGSRLFLNQHSGDLPPDSILYFQVEDIVGFQSDLIAKGVEFETAPHMVHKHEDGLEEWMAFFNDPDGRPLALMSQISAKSDRNDDGPAKTTD